MEVKYDAIYLVAERAERNSEHRVTKRKGPVRPKTVSFSGNFPIPSNPDMTYGTLVLSDNIWDEWFGDIPEDDFIEGMETPENAAESMVSSRSGIHYGCPLCAYMIDDKEDAEEHIARHVNKFYKRFTFIQDYKCPYCDKLYMQAGSLQTHIEEEHINMEE